MKRAQVDAQPARNKCDIGNSPLRVIAHARWSAQRGRRPSLSYQGERNPRRALERALTDIGATMADLHTVALHAAAVPMRATRLWMRPVRAWLHKMRLALRLLAIPYHVPQPLDDDTVERVLPEIIDLAGDLGLPMPPLRRLPALTRWIDSSDPRQLRINELRLWAAHRIFGTVPT